MHRKIYIAALVIAIVLALLFWGTIIKESTSTLVSPLLEVVAVNVKQGSVSEVVEGALKETKGRYGVVVKNLKTGESYSRGENEEFEAGSLYKLWIMVAAYKQIESGTLKPNQVLSQDIKTLNEKFNIDPDSAELTEGGITLTVSEAINQMITISHNYAALLLAEKVRLSSVERLLKTEGFNNSSLGEPPKTTPSDVALFLERLYTGELGSKEHTQEMLGIMSDQKLNDKIPKYLPQGVRIAHKTGEIGWFSHDAGIVYTDSGDYLIIVMSESDSPPGAEERIAKISEAVYKYFQEN